MFSQLQLVAFYSKQNLHENSDFVIYYSQGSRHLVRPAEKRIPKIRIETRQAESLLGHRIIVAIDSWPRTSRYPVVSVMRMEMIINSAQFAVCRVFIVNT